jgi:histidyl-tRNA synthetase
MIDPRTLSGFRDYLPEAMIPRERLIATAQRVYRSFGFSPIDTPALEYLEILTGKGSEETDRQMYHFADQGGRMVGMRFDLTVPLARFVAQHANELGLPFKRYHIATVWRGERAQRGRYREFMQCDFDTIGTKHVAADIETALVIHELLTAIGKSFGGESGKKLSFTIRVNNRMVLSGLLAKLGLAEKSVPILRSLDKLGKIGREKVAEEMAATAGTSAEQAQQVLSLAELSGTNDEVLALVEKLVAGTVFETFLTDLPTIGSICSGGRYDNLASLFTKQELPGIGASLGLDRLLAALEELGLIEKVRTPAPVLVVYFDKDQLPAYLKIAQAVRAAGIGAELFPEPKKIGQQLQYADRRGFRIALIAGERELAAGTCQVKDLASKTSAEVPLAEIPTAVQRILATS